VAAGGKWPPLTSVTSLSKQIGSVKAAIMGFGKNLHLIVNYATIKMADRILFLFPVSNYSLQAKEKSDERQKTKKRKTAG